MLLSDFSCRFTDTLAQQWTCTTPSTVVPVIRNVLPVRTVHALSGGQLLAIALVVSLGLLVSFLVGGRSR